MKYIKIFFIIIAILFLSVFLNKSYCADKKEGILQEPGRISGKSPAGGSELQ